MNFSQHLADLSSSDHNVRQNATTQSQNYAETNLGEYLFAIANEIVKESNPPGIRQLAGLFIKNTIKGQSEEIKQKRKVAWMQIAPQGRSSIKNLLLQSLAITDHNIRNACAQALAAIGIIELEVNEWPDLIPILLANCKGNNPILQEGSLTTLGYLCEEIRPVILESQSTTILEAIVSGANPNLPAEVRIASIKALLASLAFVRKNFENTDQRNYIMNVIFACAKDANDQIRLFGLYCLVVVAELYYEYLKEGSPVTYIETIWTITVDAIKNHPQAFALQGIEFWSSVAQREKDILTAEEDDYEQPEDNESESQNFTHKLAKDFVPLLFECLLKQSEDIYDDDLDVAKAASVCINIMAQTIGDGIIDIAVPLIERSFVPSAEWRHRDAAIELFGQILDGPTDERFGAFVEKAVLPIAKLIETDPSDNVKVNAAYAIARAAEFHTEAFQDATTVLHIVASVLKGVANEEPPIASRSALALFFIFDQFTGAEPTSPITKFFVPVFQQLLAAADRKDGGEYKLRVHAYEAINKLIAKAPDDCLISVSQLVKPFIDKLRATFTLTEDKNLQATLQAAISSVLLTIASKLGEGIKNYANEVIATFIELFHKRQAIIDESLLTISAVISESGSLSPEVFTHVKPIIIEAIKNVEDTSVIIAGLNCLASIGDVKKETLYTDDGGQFVDQVFQLLLQALQQPKLENEVKPLIIQSFTDISIAIGVYYEKYLDITMTVLQYAASTQVDTADEDLLEYLTTLRESILESYTSIVQSLGQEKIHKISDESISYLMKFIEFLWNDPTVRTPGIVQQIINIIGDLASIVGSRLTKFFPDVPSLTKIVDHCRKTSSRARIKEAGEHAYRLLTQL